MSAPVALCGDRIGGPIFPNKDGSVGELLLLTLDVAMTYQQILTTYQKWWGTTGPPTWEYHKSLNQNASSEKSPTRPHRTQTTTGRATPLFASICAYVKLKRLSRWCGAGNLNAGQARQGV